MDICDLDNLMNSGFIVPRWIPPHRVMLGYEDSEMLSSEGFPEYLEYNDPNSRANMTMASLGDGTYKIDRAEDANGRTYTPIKRDQRDLDVSLIDNKDITTVLNFIRNPASNPKLARKISRLSPLRKGPSLKKMTRRAEELDECWY